MPRRPDPRSKTDQLILTARNEHERKLIKGMRDVFSREAIGAMQDEMFQEIERTLARHHYPPGNPQAQLERFGSELTLICFRCGEKFSRLIRVEYISGVTGQSCKKCLEKDKRKRVVKKVLGGS